MTRNYKLRDLKHAYDEAIEASELAALKGHADAMSNMIRGFIFKTVERETLADSAAAYRKWEEDYCHRHGRAALEELARLKAPVEVAGIVARLRAVELEYPGKTTLEGEAAAALQSLAAQLAERDAENSKLRSALEIVHFKREPWQ